MFYSRYYMVFGEVGNIEALINAQNLSADAAYVSPAHLPSDANGDGIVNFLDITSFILALSNRPMYLIAFPASDPEVVLDTNHDGVFDFLDIPGFIAVLAS